MPPAMSLRDRRRRRRLSVERQRPGSVAEAIRAGAKGSKVFSERVNQYYVNVKCLAQKKIPSAC